MYRRADRHSKAQLGWRVTWRVKAGVVLLIMSSSMIGWNSAEDRERRSRIEPDGEPARSWGERGAGP